RLVGGASGQDARIGRGHVRMSADDGRYPPVQVPAHGHFLAGQLGMKIHEPHLHPGSIVSRILSILRKGQSVIGMYVRPCALMMAHSTPLRAFTITTPRPGASSE